MSVFRLSTFFSINSLGSHSVLCLRHTLKCCDEQRMSVSSKKILEKLGIPLPPKKPLTPYLKYVHQVRSKIIQNDSKLSPQEIFKIVGKQWSEYDPEQKKVLQKEYLFEVETYLSEIKKYKKSITPEQQESIKNAREKYKRAKQLANESQKKESLGKPKKPPTYFLQFMIDKKSQKPNNVKHSDWIKSMAKEWENISPSEKQKYENDAKVVLEKYRSDMLNWEESMVRQGHIDIVRNKDVLGNKLSKKQSTKATL